MVTVQIKKLDKEAKTPKYATDGSAGFDLVAVNFKKYTTQGIPVGELVEVSDLPLKELCIHAGCRALIGTGLSVALPEGYKLDIQPRSGLALKQGITVLNSPGLIDEDYRDEIGVILINHSNRAVTIKLGDRIAQGVVTKYERVMWNVVSELSTTGRTGGFGSTGVETKEVPATINTEETETLKNESDRA